MLDTKISIFRGTCTALTCIGGNDDAPNGACVLRYASHVTWETEAGVDYYILVHGLGVTVGNFELSVVEDG